MRPRLVILLLMLFVPLAGAQTGYDLRLAVEPPDGLVPINEPVELRTTWTISCQTGVASPPHPGGPGFIHWEPADMEHIHIGGPSGLNVTMPDCITVQSSEVEQTLRLSVRPQALAFLPTPAGLTGTLEWSAYAGGGTAEATHDFQVTPGAQLIIEAKVDRKLKQGTPGGMTSFFIDVTNFGNAAAVLQVTSEPAMEHPDLWPPEPIEALGGKATLEIMANHPDSFGWDNEEQGFGITLTPIAALDSENQGNPVEISVVARTRSDLEAPGPTVPMLLVGLALLARVRR